jgi:hypothetical protein
LSADVVTAGNFDLTANIQLIEGLGARVVSFQREMIFGGTLLRSLATPGSII